MEGIFSLQPIHLSISVTVYGCRFTVHGFLPGSHAPAWELIEARSLCSSQIIEEIKPALCLFLKFLSQMDSVN